MATTNVQQAQIPLTNDIPVFNNSGADIPANATVVIDSSNLMSNSTSSQTNICVAIAPTGANPPLAFGLTVDAIKNGTNGRVRGPGSIGLAVCDGAVTGGTVVDSSNSTAGRVKAHTAAKYSFALALTTGADADVIPVLVLGPTPNA